MSAYMRDERELERRPRGSIHATVLRCAFLTAAAVGLGIGVAVGRRRPAALPPVLVRSMSMEARCRSAPEDDRERDDASSWSCTDQLSC